VLGEAGSRVTVVSLPARGRPPQAAARRAGLEFVEKLLTGSVGCLEFVEKLLTGSVGCLAGRLERRVLLLHLGARTASLVSAECPCQHARVGSGPERGAGP
jgi:hypothetical protein